MIGYLMRTNTLAEASVVLSVVLAVLAAMWGNWMWVIVDLVCVVFLVIPKFGGYDYYYSKWMVGATLITPVVALILYAFNSVSDFGGELLDVNIYTYLIAGALSYQCFVLGLMFAVVMDRSYGLTMTKVWILVFALTFTMSMSAVVMFFTFGQLYVEGYPVFNEDFYDSDRYTNATLMVTPVMATIVSAMTLIFTVLTTSGHDKSYFLEGAEQ